MQQCSIYSKAFDRRFASASTVGYCCSSYLRLSRRFAPARGAVRTGYPTEAPRHVTKSTPAPMGAGGSILKKGGNSHTILLNAAHAVPALLKDQTAAQCRTISATLEKLKEEADRMAALKERGEDQKSGLEGNKARSRTSEDQVQTKWDEVGATSLKRAFSSCDMIDAEWLVQLADRNGILPRNQDIPDQAKVSIEEMERWDDQCLVFGAVVICLPWMNPLHPDPTGCAHAFIRPPNPARINMLTSFRLFPCAGLRSRRYLLFYDAMLRRLASSQDAALGCSGATPLCPNPCLTVKTIAMKSSASALTTQSSACQVCSDISPLATCSV